MQAVGRRRREVVLPGKIERVSACDLSGDHHDSHLSASVSRFLSSLLQFPPHYFLDLKGGDGRD